MKTVETLLNPFLGYIELGMFDDAHEELESLPSEVKTHRLVLAARFTLLVQLKKWDQAALLGESICKLWPNELEFHFKTAHCLHQLKRTQEAKDTLLAGPQTIRETAIYWYTLACYETQQGHQDAARDLFKQCFQIDPKFREVALEEVDLEPLWMAIIV